MTNPVVLYKLAMLQVNIHSAMNLAQFDVALADHLTILSHMHLAMQSLEAAIKAEVREARAQDHTWVEIGNMLHIHESTARARYANG
jgi:hypothetical protein